MSTITADAVRAASPTAHPIPLVRVTQVELRKMFDTRSGYWLMASVVIAAVLATAAVILFAPDGERTYSSFAIAIHIPVAVILPLIAVLSVTSEWSQRSGLTTFTLIPHRSRVIAAKAIASLSVAFVSMLLVFAIAALGNLVGSVTTHTAPVWDASLIECLYFILGNVLSLLIGFMLGVLIRGSAGAIAAYFVYSGLLPTVFGLLAASQRWFKDLQPWIDLQNAQGALFRFESALTGEQWASIGVTGVIWLAIPLAVGLGFVMRAEVK